MSLRNKLKVILSILFITFFVNFYLSYTLEKDSESKIYMMENTQKTIHLTTLFIDSLKDAETGQRGFLLTLDPSYLEPYYAGTKKVILYYDLLHNSKLLHNYGDEQHKRLEKIKILMDKKLKELNETIQLAKKGTRSEAIKLVKRNLGQYYMDKIDNIIQKIIQTEAMELQRKKDEYIFTKSRNFTLMVVALTFFILLSLYMVIFINSYLFNPLELLLSNTHKIDKGETIDVKDIVSQDEMGYLLSSFYKMSQKVYIREKKLNYTASHDELTSLPNRVNLHEDIDLAILEAKKNNLKVAILFLDLNKFKAVNDNLGHEAGDLMLKESAKRFASVLRSDDKVFRIGGDEFLILLKDISNSSDIDRVIEQLLLSIQDPIEYKSHKLQISVSIGVALFPEDANIPDELIKASDIAMYAAKKDNKINFRYFDNSLLNRSSDKRG